MKITSILSFGLLGALTLGFVSCNHASSDVGRVREVIQAPDGNIYLSVESKGLYKMVAKA